MTASDVIGELAERLAELQLEASEAGPLVVVLPLKSGSQDAVRALLDTGPPFDPEAIEGLERHEVFVTAAEVVFFFESTRGRDALAALLSRAEVWGAAAAWHEHIEGLPRVAESVFAWSRPDQAAGVYYLPTPGPGYSEGGDIF